MYVAAKAFNTPEEAKKWVEENFTEAQRREWFVLQLGQEMAVEVQPLPVEGIIKSKVP